jgi:hypothetical protein
MLARMFEFENGWTDFHEIWYAIYVVAGLHNLVVLNPLTVIGLRTYKMQELARPE